MMLHGYISDRNPIATANYAAWMELLSCESVTLTYLGKFLDDDYKQFWYPAAPATPSGLADLCGTDFITRMELHAVLCEVVIAQELANNRDPSKHKWAKPVTQNGQIIGYEPAIPDEFVYIPDVDSDHNLLGSAKVYARVATKLSIIAGQPTKRIV